MKTQLEKDLYSIGETPETLALLNDEFLKWGKKRGWYITVNRINKKGWLVYGLNDNLQQHFNYIGIGILEDYFDKPTTMLNKFINS